MQSHYLQHVKERIGLRPGAIDVPGKEENPSQKFHVFEYNDNIIEEFDTDDFNKKKI